MGEIALGRTPRAVGAIRTATLWNDPTSCEQAPHMSDEAGCACAEERMLSSGKLRALCVGAALLSRERNAYVLSSEGLRSAS